MKPPKALYVEWLDSGQTSGWLYAEGLEECDSVICRTVGFLARETKTSLILALNYNTQHDTSARFGHVIAIPKVAIVRRKSLPC